MNRRISPLIRLFPPGMRAAGRRARRSVRRAAKRSWLVGRKARAAAALAPAMAAFEARNYPRVRQALEPLLAAQPTEVRALQLLARTEVREGDFARAAALSARAASLANRPEMHHQARMTAGRIIETDAGWLPRVTSQVVAPEPQPDRVLYLAKESMPFHSNGFCTRSHETLKALRGAGWEPIGVTMPGFPATVGIDAGGASVSEVEQIAYRHVLPDAPGVKHLPFDQYLELAANLVAREVAAAQPSLLHIGSGHRGYETALVGRALAAWSGLPWLYEVRSFFETTWTDDDRYMESAPYFHRRFDTESRCMRAADLVVTLSGPMRDEIVNRHGVPAERVLTVPNAVDLTRFVPVERDGELRRRLGLEGTAVLGYISNLDHAREGQEVLLRAAARLRGQGRDVSVLLVGDGRRRAELTELAQSLGLGDRAVFTGNVPFAEVAAYYAQIDLFVVPRVDERAGRLVSPMKPFEAMAMRVPVLVSDLPALQEIADGSGCATFHAGDADALAAEAANLLDHPEELARRVEAAADWVRRERTWEANGRAFAAAYESARQNAESVTTRAS